MKKIPGLRLLTTTAALAFLSATLTIRAAPPTITSQPTPQATILGGRAVFTVMASGTPPLAYQWRKDGVDISGATSDVLLLSNVQFADAGNYAVVVSDPGGSVTSASAGLAVNAPRGGDVDFSFDPGSALTGTVESMAVQADGKVLIGGEFSTVNGVARNRIARLNSDGSLDTGFQNGMTGVNDYVLAVAVQADGKVLIGGNFTSVNGVTRNRIARLHTDGSLDTGFQNGMAGVNDYVVYAVVVQPDGKVLIGGNFTTVNGVSRNYIARLRSDGSLDTTFQNGMGGLDGAVESVAVQADGKVLIGGGFATVNGVSRNRIARLNSDGSLDTTFQNEMTGANSYVRAVAVQADGKVLIGGVFTTVNGVSRNYIARLHSDGSLDTTFQNGMTGASAWVDSVAVQPDGKVLIGGNFTSVNGVSRSRIARLDSDGSLDTGFNPSSGANNTVNSVAVQADGKVLIGGWFTTVNALSRNRIARLNSDGSLDTGFQNGMAGANSSVYPVVVQADGKVLIGGYFATVNGVTRSRIARLWGSDQQVAPTDISLSAGGVAENQPSGTAVGSFSAVDSNAGDTHTFALVSGAGDTDNASFAVAGNELRTAAVFNYEARNSYSIRVRATDAAGLFFEKVFTISVTDVNDAPVAALAVYNRGPEMPLKILVADLLERFTSDEDNDARTLVGVGAGTNNAAIWRGGAHVFYLPSATDPQRNTTDHFGYEISDGRGGAAANLVRVTVGQDPGSLGANIEGIELLGGRTRIKFRGIPGYGYRVQRTELLAGPNTVWTDLGVAPEVTTGYFEYEDWSPPATAYYRTVWP